MIHLLSLARFDACGTVSIATLMRSLSRTVSISVTLRDLMCQSVPASISAKATSGTAIVPVVILSDEPKIRRPANTIPVPR